MIKFLSSGLLAHVFWISCVYGESIGKLGLVDVQSINPTIQVELRYATTHNFTGQRIYPESLTTCYVLKIVAEKLDLVQKELASKAFGLKIWDGVRSVQAQKRFWELCPDERYVAPPSKGGRHTRGTSVDLTLIYLQDGSEVPMPTEFDSFSQQAHRDYSDLSEDVITHRDLLRDVMQKYGFVQLATEWWHFDLAGWQNYPVLDVDFNLLFTWHYINQ